MRYRTKTWLITLIITTALMSGSLSLATAQFQDAGFKGDRYIKAVEFFEKSGFDFIFNNPSQSQLDTQFTSENGIEDYFAIYRERATFTTQSESFRADALFSQPNLETISSPFIATRLLRGDRIEVNRVYIDEVLAARGNLTLGAMLTIRLDLEVSLSLTIGGVFPKDPYYQDGIAYFVLDGAVANAIDNVYTNPFPTTKLKYGKAFITSNNNQLINAYRNNYAPEGRMLGPENFFTNLEYISYVDNFRTQSYPLDTISAATEIQYFTNFYKPSYDEALSVGKNQFLLISLITIFLSVVLAKIISRQLLISGGKDLMLKQYFIYQSFAIVSGKILIIASFLQTYFFLLDSYLVKNDIIREINSLFITLGIFLIVLTFGLFFIDQAFSNIKKQNPIKDILNQKVPADFKFRDIDDKKSKKD